MFKNMRALASLLLLSACSFGPPTPPETTYCAVREPLAGADLVAAVEALKTRQTAREGYNRAQWGRWSDFDDDCQDTRAEALLDSNKGAPITFTDDRACVVSTGAWVGPYTLETYDRARDLDLDHVVALRTVYELVGHNPASRLEALDFELLFIEHGNLLLVDRSANRSKGARGPAHWLPVTTGLGAPSSSATPTWPPPSPTATGAPPSR